MTETYDGGILGTDDNGGGMRYVEHAKSFVKPGEEATEADLLKAINTKFRAERKQLIKTAKVELKKAIKSPVVPSASPSLDRVIANMQAQCYQCRDEIADEMITKGFKGVDHNPEKPRQVYDPMTGEYVIRHHDDRNLNAGASSGAMSWE